MDSTKTHVRAEPTRDAGGAHAAKTGEVAVVGADRGQLDYEYYEYAHGQGLVTPLEAIERAGAVGDLEVLDINYPFSDPDIGVDDVRGALAAANLAADTITPHIYTREFVAGAFTNPDPSVRRRALALCEEAVDVAREEGLEPPTRGL